jgi:hypothetical protein
MYLIHESTIKNPDGVIDITVHVIEKKTRKKYEYHLSSQKAAETFHSLYRKGSKCHGKALSILNKNKI